MYTNDEIYIKVNELEKNVSIIEKDLEYLKQNIETQNKLYKELLVRLEELTKTNIELKVTLEKLSEKLEEELEADNIYQKIISKLLKDDELKKFIVLSVYSALSIFIPIAVGITILIKFFIDKLK